MRGKTDGPLVMCWVCGLVQRASCDGHRVLSAPVLPRPLPGPGS